jgi:hypothetical protein
VRASFEKYRILDDLKTSGFDALEERFVVVAPQRRMCFLCGLKAGIDSEMDARAVASKPGAASGCELVRFGHFLEPEDRAVKVASGVFASGGHGKLDVVDFSNQCRRKSALRFSDLTK